MKKLFALLVAANFLVGTIGCSGGNTTPTGSSAKTADNILPPKATDRGMAADSPRTHVGQIGPLEVTNSTAPSKAGNGDPKAADGESLKAGSRTLDDLKVTRLKLPGKAVLPCMLWADAEGSSFLTLEGGTGVLRRISFPHFRVTKQKDLETKFIWMSRSAEGLVLSADSDEIWVVDPDTLEVKSKIAVPKCKRAASAPGLSVAIACDRDASSNQGDVLANAKIYVVDLKKKTAAPWEMPKSLEQGQLIGLENPAVTPDGRYVFTTHNGQIFRFSLKHGNLNYEESTEVLWRGGAQANDSWSMTLQKNGPESSTGIITISPDSKLVGMANVNGNLREKFFSTGVFPVDSFQKHNCTLDQGRYPQALGFDLKAGYIYTQNAENELIIFTLGGAKKKEYNLENTPLPPNPGYSRAAGSVWQYLVHPDGNQIVMLTSDGGYFIEVPRKP